MDIFSLKTYIVVTDVVNDVTYSRKSVNTRVVIWFLWHDIIHWKTASSYDKGWNKAWHQAESLQGCCTANPLACMWDMDSIPTSCKETSPFPLKLLKKAAKYQVARQDSRHRPVNSPGYPVILTVLPWTYDLPYDFNLKRQTNGFPAVYRLILTSETKKKTYPGFSVFTQTKSRSLQFPVEFGDFRLFRLLFLAYSASLGVYSRFSDLF